MKTIKITLLAIFTLVGVSAMAQKDTKPADRQARIDAYLTEQLALTETEQKAFLPVYKQYKAELSALRKASKASKNQELEEVIQASFDDKQKMLDTKKKYHEKFKKVISIKKVAKLYHVEKRMGKHTKGNKKGKGNKEKKSGERPAKPTLQN